MSFKLNLSKRDIVGKRVRALRAQGYIPGVIYGKKVHSQSVQVPYNEFFSVYKKAGGSALIDASVADSAPRKVLIHGVSKNNVSDKIEHVDFLAVDMKEKLKTDVPLKFVGESKAVKESGGVLIHNFDSLEIECLPEDLIPEINIDISPLNEIGDAIYVKDIKLGDKEGKIKIFLHPDDPVASIAAPRTEEELKALDEKVEEKVEDIEVLKKTKDETKDEEESKAEPS